MDQVRAILDAAKTPGYQYVAVDARTTLVECHGGFADLASSRQMLASTPMMAYSMSKTITALAVLQLVEARRVALDDPVASYVDAQPYGDEITVRQLLCHTSGIPNPLPLRWVHPVAAHDGFDEGAALARVLRDHPRLTFRPGAKYAYSNIGYWLLGRVVERAGRRPFLDYMDRYVLQPLGAEPGELSYAAADPSTLASGYLEKYSVMNLIKRLVIDGALIGKYKGPWLQIRAHYLNGPAFGGLVGTARGFATFLQDQLRDESRLLGDAARQLFFEQQRTRDGRAIDMTLGWHVGSSAKRRFYYKEGGGGGFHSLMRIYPDRGMGTVVIANATGVNVHTLLDRVDPLVRVSSAV